MWNHSKVPFIAALLLVIAAVGCNQKMTFQIMGDQPKYRPLVSSNLFPDGQSARPRIPDTVARGHVEDDSLLYTGRVDGNYAAEFPYPITRDALTRGQERFDIFCAPCHGRTGSGNGIVVQRGFTPPPTFHSDDLRSMPVGQFFDVITNGFGAMPSYAGQIPVSDRWATIAYIRALQLSQNATINDVPEDERSKLGGP